MIVPLTDQMAFTPLATGLRPEAEQPHPGCSTLRRVTMSAKSISPAGWRYLVKEVASNDAPRVPGQDLAGYYLQTGNQTGRWVGRLAEAEGLTGRPVSEEGMRSSTLR